MRRIWHPWTAWECFRAGFYETTCELPADDAKRAYAEFLRDTPRFEAALDRVLAEWPRSCEHFLTNESINRIAWLGQASMCIATGIPSVYRGGFRLLSDVEQKVANATAAKFLGKWQTEVARRAQQDWPVHQDMEGARLFG